MSPQTTGELDPVIHSQARLRIMTTLCALPAGDRLTFPRLQSLLDATAGNLSTHLRRLEDAGYVVVTKGFAGRVPRTEVEATTAGRRAFEDYVAALRTLLTPPDVEADAGAAGTAAGSTPTGTAATGTTTSTRAATTARATTTTSTEGDA